MRKILIAHCNPDDACVAAEVEIIRRHIKYSKISSIDLTNIVGQFHPEQGLRDYVYHKIDQKYKKFIKEEINGEDITDSIACSKISLVDIPESIDLLANYKINDVKIGLAALGTAASFSRCTSDNCVDYGKYLADSWKVAHKSYYAGLSVSEDYDFNVVILFNGRHAISRPFSEAIRLNGKTVVMHYEFNAQRTNILFSKNEFFSQEYISKKIRKTIPNKELSKIFFTRKLERIPGSFDEKIRRYQIPGSLPPEIKNECFIAFFTSSPDEFFTEKDELRLSQAFKTQYDVAYKAAEFCNQLNIKFVVRLHPHLQFKHDSWRAEWNFEELLGMGVTIVYPNEAYDSYAILLRSKGMLSCGSTIGIEAAYYGIPAADIGTWIPGLTFCANVIQTTEELKKFIQKPEAMQGSYDSAVKAATYFSCQSGLPFVSHRNDATLKIDNRFVSLSSHLINKIKRLRVLWL